MIRLNQPYIKGPKSHKALNVKSANRSNPLSLISRLAGIAQIIRCQFYIINLNKSNAAILIIFIMS